MDHTLRLRSYVADDFDFYEPFMNGILRFGRDKYPKIPSVAYAYEMKPQYYRIKDFCIDFMLPEFYG